MSESPLPNTYDANDMHFAYVVAFEDLKWVNISLDDIKAKVEKLKADCVEKGVHPYTFNNLETFLDINEFTMKNRCDYYDQEVEEIRTEIDALNKGALK